MPHPKLVRWKPSGVIGLCKTKDDRLHLVTDFEGRASIHELVSVFKEIEYSSSISIQPKRPPAESIDENIKKNEPSWFESAKLTGGGRVPQLTLVIEGNEEIEIDLKEFEKITSEPNYGYDEITIGKPEILTIW